MPIYDVIYICLCFSMLAAFMLGCMQLLTTGSPRMDKSMAIVIALIFIFATALFIMPEPARAGEPEAAEFEDLPAAKVTRYRVAEWEILEWERYDGAYCTLARWPGFRADAMLSCVRN